MSNKLELTSRFIDIINAINELQNSGTGGGSTDHPITDLGNFDDTDTALGAFLRANDGIYKFTLGTSYTLGVKYTSNSGIVYLNIVSGDYITKYAYNLSTGELVDDNYATEEWVNQKYVSLNDLLNFLNLVVLDYKNGGTQNSKGYLVMGSAYTDQNGNPIHETYATKDELANVGGSGSVDTSNLVTLDGAQSITGQKNFSGGASFGGAMGMYGFIGSMAPYSYNGFMATNSSSIVNNTVYKYGQIVHGGKTLKLPTDNGTIATQEWVQETALYEHRVTVEKPSTGLLVFSYKSKVATPATSISDILNHMITNGNYAVQDYIPEVNGYWNTSDHVYAVQLGLTFLILYYGTTAKNIAMITNTDATVSSDKVTEL